MIRHRRSRPRRATLKLTAALAVLSLTAAPSALATPGDLDSTFGSGGIALTPVGSDDYVRDLAVQADGKIIAAGASSADGTTYRFALARHNADGSLDPTFGSGGKVVTSLGTSAMIHAVALQPDGKIVVGGRVYSGGSSDFAVARYTSAGALDTTFGTGGVVTTAIGNDSTAWDLGLEPDGRIVVAGQARVTGRQRVALARYTSAGALDASFGTSGRTTLTLGTGDAYAYGLARQADGRLVVAGGADDNGVAKFAVARFGTDGALDPSFGTGGSVLSAIGFGSTANSILVDPDGRLVVGGMSVGFTTRFAVVRYTANGAFDGSFSTNGVAYAQPGFTAFANSLARQSDGRLLVAGQVVGSSGQRFALSRFNADGSTDTGFGTGGSVTTAIGSTGEAFKVAMQADDRILVGGTGDSAGGVRQFALARYESAAPPSDPPPSDPPPSDPPPSDPPPSDPPPSDPPPSDPPPSDPAPTGGNGQQVVPIDELGLIPPDVKPIVMPQQQLKLQGTNLVPIKLRCVELPTAGCKGTVLITAPLAAMGVKGGGGKKGKLTASRRRKTKPKMVRIARRKVSIPSGQDATLKLQLSGAAQRALELRGSLRIQVTASMEVGGEIRASRRNFTLRAKKKKKSRRIKSRR